MPKIDAPSAATSAPSFSVPKSNVELPKVSLPSFSTPSFSSSGSNVVEFDGESQEIRDEKAKDARTSFNEADSSAKVSFSFLSIW